MSSKGAAFGNFVDIAFEPLGKRGDYHINAGSPAVGQAVATPASLLARDIDWQPRPETPGGDPDMGADEVPLAMLAAQRSPTAGSASTAAPPTAATLEVRRRQLLRRLQAQGMKPDEIRRILRQLDSRHR